MLIGEKVNVKIAGSATVCPELVITRLAESQKVLKHGMTSIACPKSSQMVSKITELNLDFTRCGKTLPGGRLGIYPRHETNQINLGFSP